MSWEWDDDDLLGNSEWERWQKEKSKYGYPNYQSEKYPVIVEPKKDTSTKETKKEKDKKGTTYVPSCNLRHKKELVFVTSDDISYFAGSCRDNTDLMFHPNPILVIALNNRDPNLKGAGERLKVVPEGLNIRPFFPKNRGIPLVLDWTDFGEPPFRYGMARAIHKWAKEQKLSEILMYCQGGHGRTGTMLASFLIEVEQWGAADAINFVRKVYCKKAVETQGQVDWLVRNELWVEANRQHKTIKEK